MNIPEILFAVGTEEDGGCGYLILNEFGQLPICGKVVQYKSHIAMLTAISNKEPLAFAPVVGYSIAIVFAGIIGGGSRLSVQSDTAAKLTKVMERMAHWYLSNKCERHKGRFKRYEIN